MDSIIFSVDGMKGSMVTDGNITVFAGVAENRVFNIEHPVDRRVKLLTRAVNNRTRERNYFRKYCELLEGQISDEEFDREISEHEDEYVVSQDEATDIKDWETAILLAPQLKDTDYVDDVAALFSLSHQSYQKLLTAE